jgi:hypothetical protein
LLHPQPDTAGTATAATATTITPVTVSRTYLEKEHIPHLHHTDCASVRINDGSWVPVTLTDDTVADDITTKQRQLSLCCTGADLQLLTDLYTVIPAGTLCQLWDSQLVDPDTALFRSATATTCRHHIVRTLTRTHLHTRGSHPAVTDIVATAVADGDTAGHTPSASWAATDARSILRTLPAPDTNLTVTYTPGTPVCDIVADAYTALVAHWCHELDQQFADLARRETAGEQRWLVIPVATVGGRQSLTHTDNERKLIGQAELTAIDGDTRNDIYGLYAATPAVAAYFASYHSTLAASSNGILTSNRAGSFHADFNSGDPGAHTFLRLLRDTTLLRGHKVAELEQTARALHRTAS